MEDGKAVARGAEGVCRMERPGLIEYLRIQVIFEPLPFLGRDAQGISGLFDQIVQPVPFTVSYQFLLRQVSP